jgi:hypothetical protein
MKERWRYRHMPRVSRWLLDLSTWSARKALKSAHPIQLLVDNTVLTHGITHETAWISEEVGKWGKVSLETGYMARIPVHAVDDESEAYRNIRYLAGIAHLARRGAISLRTSAELQAERFCQPSGRYTGYGSFDHSVFRGIEMHSVDGYVMPTMGPTRFGFPSAVDQQRTRIDQSGDSLYQALVAVLGRANSQDAWHVRTAEVHGVYCFLTMDFKLVRALKCVQGKAPFKTLRTSIMTPKQFGERWGLIPLPPYILSYDDASFFVRPDLHWADGKRRPRRTYKPRGRRSR